MRSLRYLSSTAMVLALTAHPASGSTSGTMGFNHYVDETSRFVVALGRPDSASGTAGRHQLSEQIRIGGDASSESRSADIHFTLFGAGADEAPQAGAFASEAPESIETRLAAGVNALLQLAGILQPGDKAIETDRNVSVFEKMVPLPPAILLLLSGLGAVLGIRSLRKSGS